MSTKSHDVKFSSLKNKRMVKFMMPLWFQFMTILYVKRHDMKSSSMKKKVSIKNVSVRLSYLCDKDMRSQTLEGMTTSDRLLDCGYDILDEILGVGKMARDI